MSADTDPAAPTPERFRATLGSFPTGVVVVTCADQHGPTGLAANSFTSVSLDPPLVGFCPARSSTTWPRIRSAGRFAVSVLAGDQRDVSDRFAQRGGEKFDGVGWTATPTGSPVIDGCLAWLDCLVEKELPAGDHFVVLGRVVSLGHREGEPLVFFRGQYSKKVS